MRIIDKERVPYSGADTTGLKLNEFRLQIEFNNDILKAVATNRETSVYILTTDKKWTKLKSFKLFDYDYNNEASNFIVDLASYLNSFYNTDEFNTITD